jgi:hypothetical protein
MMTVALTAAAFVPSLVPAVAFGAGRPTAGSWVPTGDMTAGRGGYAGSATATGLPATGRVLVAGGFNSLAVGGPQSLASSELYDDAAGTWSATGSMTTDREAHTATLLPSGKVLVAGGNRFGRGVLASAELYDASTGAWTSTGSMMTPHDHHTATLLDGPACRGATPPAYCFKVLVAGGGVPDSRTAELYDPATGIWSATGSMSIYRVQHTATLLRDGRVLVVGNDKAAEVYDPGTGTWSPAGSMTFNRVDHSATLLPDGRVLVAGGCCTPRATTLASVELYDPGSGQWRVARPMITPRGNHTATLLGNGDVLVAGGIGGNSGIAGCCPLSSSQVYDPESGAWQAATQLNTARAFHVAVLLPNGRVLAAGGIDSKAESTPSGELFS